MKTVEHRIITKARPQAIFKIYQDVGNWHTWDPDTKKAELNGPLILGSRGRLTPSTGTTVPMLVTSMTPDQSFTVESIIPLFRMVFEHELNPVKGGTEIVHRVTFSGFMSFLLGPILARQVDAGLPATLANLKQLAETGKVG
jgi:Polyketide cyclase / dehydrase and lipid transport